MTAPELPPALAARIEQVVGAAVFAEDVEQLTRAYANLLESVETLIAVVGDDD